MSDPIELNLSKPIKYSKGGDEVETELLVLKPPTGKVSVYCCEIESLIQSGIISMSESIMSKEEMQQAKQDAEEGSAVKKDMDEESFWSLVTASGADMSKIVLNFRALFKQTVLMGNEKLITEARLDDLDHKDMKRLMGVYGANFIMT